MLTAFTLQKDKVRIIFQKINTDIHTKKNTNQLSMNKLRQVQFARKSINVFLMAEPREGHYTMF